MWWTADGHSASGQSLRHRPRVLCDWGGSRLRAFLEIDGAVTDRREGPGILRLLDETPAQALGALLSGWADGLRAEVFLCGMAGSRNGLAEVPYVRAPATLGTWRRGGTRLKVGDLEACIAPGIQADNFRGAPDVMRGEETQIFGAVSLERGLGAGSRMIVLPGTHSKWVEVRDGAIVRVQTYFTGELFDLLCRQSSLLRVATDPGRDEEGFEAGLRAGERGDLAASLFETRTAQLIAGRSAAWARAFLSGLLIGAELASMLAQRALACDTLMLIGEPDLTVFYLRALAARHIGAEALDGERCVLAGLRALAAAEES